MKTRLPLLLSLLIPLTASAQEEFFEDPLPLDALGGSEINDLEATDPPNVVDDEIYIGSGAGAGVWTLFTDCNAAGEAVTYDTGLNVLGCITGLGAGGTIDDIVGDDNANATTGANISIDGGTGGIDTDTVGDVLTITFDSTEVGTNTWGTGSGITWTWNVGATDPALAFTSDSLVITNVATFTANGSNILTAALSSGSAITGTTATSFAIESGGGDSAISDNSILFEGTGADDDFETILLITNPTADRTMTFPNQNVEVGIDTDNLTYRVDDDNALAEPADNAGFIIEGGSGTDVTILYETTDNTLDFVGAASGYDFDAAVAVAGVSTLTGETDIGTSPTIFSNTDITLQLDEDNNSTSSVIIQDGADAAIFTFTEAGTLTWGGTAILETGTALQFGDASDATVTHTYANTGTNTTVAWSSALATFSAGVTVDGATIFTGETDLGSFPTVFSNTSITMQLDEDADGTESFIIQDGADAAIWTFQEDGVLLHGATINDDVCDTAGEWWYDTTDTAFEFCEAASGAPTELGSFDSTTVDNTTWSDNANATNTWTFDVSGTDHTMIAGSALMTFSAGVTVDGAGTITGVSTLTGETDIGSSPTIFSNTDITLQLDEDNNSTSSVIIQDGADAAIWTFAEAGTLTWGGTAILESGTAFQFGDASDATLTHTYANTGTNTTVAWSSALATFSNDVTVDGATTLTGETDIGSSPTIFSNTSITMQLDEDADGTESFIINDGADAAIWTFAEAGTLTWGGTAILESGTAFQFGDASDATVTHTYANTGTDVTIAYSTAAMAVTGTLTATNLSGTNTGDGGIDTTTVDDTTWSDNANATNTWTFDVSGTDHTAIFGSAITTWSGDIAIGADPADAGAIRLEDTAAIQWEGTAEISIEATAADVLSVTNSQAGILLVTTTATECVMLDAAGINCKTSGGCSTADVAGSNFDYTVAAFTDADGLGHWSFQLPDNLSGTTAASTVYWTADDAACSNGTDDDVCWTLDGDSYAASAAFETGALGGTQVAATDRCHTDGDLLVIGLPAFTHSMVAGERAVVEIGRDADGTDAECSSGDDDFTGDADLLALKFCYEVDNVFSGE